MKRGQRITAPELQELITSNIATILVLERMAGQPELAGCVLIENHGKDAHIGLLAVTPDLQNLGLGKLLLKAAEDHARIKFSCTNAKMFVLSGRDELLSWYKRFGYVETGEKAQFPGPETGLTALRSDATLL